jgi:hypothetical protein
MGGNAYVYVIKGVMSYVCSLYQMRASFTK